jgi:glycosyltransferase involved in cell wall biosynthesis
LFVVNDPAFVLSHRLPIARAAKKSGFEVHLATPDEECVVRIEQEGFVFHPIPLSKCGTNILAELRTLLALIRLFRQLQPRLIHLVTIKPVIYGGIAARVAGVPAVVSAITGLGHLFVQNSGGGVSILRSLAQRVYCLALNHMNQRVIFQNPDDMECFVRSRMVSKERSDLIRGSGVDMDLFVPGAEPSGRPVVLLASRLLWEKGVADFVTAARALSRRGCVARFVLAGGGNKWNPSTVPEDQLRAWQDEGIVEWWGEVDNMPEVMGGATVVCLPSYYGEGIPKVLIEAAACGKPIVTTDTPGCREIVQDGVNGILVPAREPEAVAQAIGRLLDDRELRLQMGRRGRAIAEKEYAVGRVVQQTLAVYQRLLPEIEIPR